MVRDTHTGRNSQQRCGNAPAPGSASPVSGTSAERVALLAARRIVLKLGTNVVADSEGGVNRERLKALAASVARLRAAGRQIVIVSSGAVGLGRDRLQLPSARARDLVTRQACAAVGQVRLMSAYEQLFSAHELPVAQVLLTESDFSDRKRCANLRHTIEKLLKLGVVPIVNENDTVSTAELEYLTPTSAKPAPAGGPGDPAPSSTSQRPGAPKGTTGAAKIFSDNDRLAALVMSRVEADALVLLSNVDGILRNQNDQAEVIPLVTQITPELRGIVTGPSSGGRGGMVTKLEAAEIATRAGGVAIIANGKNPGTLDRIFAGDAVGTLLAPSVRVVGKRRWIMYAADVRGRVTVNRGAHDALLAGKASLLCAGVTRIDEAFEREDVISIVTSDGREFARGIANFSHAEAERMLRDGENRPAAKPLVSRENLAFVSSPSDERVTQE
jgi:glutamate 5-kinase